MLMDLMVGKVMPMMPPNHFCAVVSNLFDSVNRSMSKLKLTNMLNEGGQFSMIERKETSGASCMQLS